MLPGMKAPNPDKVALARTGQDVRQRLSANPAMHRVPVDKAEIWAMSGFLQPGECDRLIEMIDRVAEPSLRFESNYDASYRTSHSGNFDPHDPFVRTIERRFDDLLGISHGWGETIQGQLYREGQEFRTHMDWFTTTQSYWPEQQRSGGQRSFTAMVYLNSVDEGGSTDFPYLGVSIPPTPGALIVWNNADVDGTPNEATLHAGTPVVRGVKYIITKWYRTRNWEPK